MSVVGLNPESLGFRAPRVFYTPPGIVSLAKAREALECARAFGIVLDDWQELSVLASLATRADGKFAAFETGVEVPRQNGKGGVLETIELAGVEVFGEKLIVHSAHEFNTASEAMLRMEEILAGRPGLVRKVSRAHGTEGFTFMSGQRIRYRTRTKGGGRGMTGDRVILDEAMILPEAMVGALIPTMAAKSMTGNPQVNYAGSAVDQLIHEHGVPFARLRARAMRGVDPSLAYLGWSAAVPTEEGRDPTPEDVDERIASSPEVWRAANPALGIRISEEHVAAERRSMDRRTFAVERLGVGDWPDVDDEVASVIDRERWAACLDEDAAPGDPLWFGFDVSPSRAFASIVAAGWFADGLPCVEVIDSRRGTGWLEDRLVGLLEHRPAGFVCDDVGPAASMVAALAKRRVKVKTSTAGDMAKACGTIFDRVEKGSIRHRGDAELTTAVRVAAKRKLGERWAWSRGTSRGDITSLVSATLAVWALETGRRPRSAPAVLVR